MKGSAYDNFKFNAIAVAVVCVALITPLTAASRWSESSTIHPNHFSTAEVGWNEKTGKFEIALCVWPSDLEKALAEIAGKSIDLEQKEGLEELMAQYIASKFTIRKVEKDSASADQTDVADSKSGSAKSNRQSESDAETASASSDSRQTDEGSSTESKQSDSVNASDLGLDTKKTDPDSQKSSNTSAAETQPTTDAVDTQNVQNAPPTSKADADAEQESHGHISSAEKDGEPKVVKELPEDFRWVGFESNAKDAWLYFELPGDLEPATFEIENRVFFEFNEEQINQIRFTCAGQTRSFSLKRNVPTWQFTTERAKLRKQNPGKSPSDER